VVCFVYYDGSCGLGSILAIHLPVFKKHSSIVVDRRPFIDTYMIIDIFPSVPLLNLHLTVAHSAEYMRYHV
jgi:hypothetical protein